MLFHNLKENEHRKWNEEEGERERELKTNACHSATECVVL